MRPKIRNFLRWFRVCFAWLKRCCYYSINCEKVPGDEELSREHVCEVSCQYRLILGYIQVGNDLCLCYLCRKAPGTVLATVATTEWHSVEREEHTWRTLTSGHSLCVSRSVVSTLSNPMDCNLPGSSIHGILQARILEWVAISFSRRSSQPRDRNHVSCIAGRFFTIWATREALRPFLTPS